MTGDNVQRTDGHKMARHLKHMSSPITVNSQVHYLHPAVRLAVHNFCVMVSSIDSIRILTMFIPTMISCSKNRSV